jgi:hypothetical protein
VRCGTFVVVVMVVEMVVMVAMVVVGPPIQLGAAVPIQVGQDGRHGLPQGVVIEAGKGGS